MTARTATPQPGPGPRPRVAVAQVGDWWTVDAPSLRVAGPDGRYTSIWSVGRGPTSVVLAADGDHDFWVPLLPHLSSDYTLHAVDPLAPEGAMSAEQSNEITERGICTAAAAVGATAIVGWGETAAQVHRAAIRSDWLSVAVLVRAGDHGDSLDDPDSPGTLVAFIDAADDAAAASLGPVLRRTLANAAPPAARAAWHEGTQGAPCE